jgi:predicted alpha/beta-fold hydrolase
MALPTRSEVADSVVLDYPASGGHVGFVSGSFPGASDWLPTRIAQFFARG